MKNFAEWCQEKNLIEIAADGSVSWLHTPVRGGKKVPHKEKMSGSVRSTVDDLSSDYTGHSGMNGTVWPFKVAKSKPSGKHLSKGK